MLIIPLQKKFSRRNVPVVTGLLLLINVFVFFALQGNDGELLRQAAVDYDETGMLAREWKWFEQWAAANQNELVADPAEVEAMAEYLDAKQLAPLRTDIMSAHPGFHEALAAGEYAALDSVAYRDFERAHTQFQSARDRVFTVRYLLRYDEIDPVNALVHMFMHGSFMHLFGNMLFLVLLGLLVEGVLGGPRFLVAYLISGLGAVVASLLVHWGEGSGGLGASGAIAGLMGLFAVLYGKRRVRFFYWAFVYFDYVRAPALILLPLWLGWEVLQFVLMGDGSNVAYEAHMGGILTGAVLALGLKQSGWVNTDFMDEEVQLDHDRDAVALAQKDLADLNAESAKRRLRPLLSRHGDDPELWRLYFGACRQRLDDAEVHEAAKRVFSLRAQTLELRCLQVDVFAEYCAHTRQRPRLNKGQAISLAGRFASWGEFAHARFLIDRLSRAPSGEPALADATLVLAERLRRDGKSVQAAHYFALVQRLQPGSAAARRAADMANGMSAE